MALKRLDWTGIPRGDRLNPKGFSLDAHIGRGNKTSLKPPGGNEQWL